LCDLCQPVFADHCLPPVLRTAAPAFSGSVQCTQQSSELIQNPPHHATTNGSGSTIGPRSSALRVSSMPRKAYSFGRRLLARKTGMNRCRSCMSVRSRFVSCACVAGPRCKRSAFDKEWHLERVAIRGLQLLWITGGRFSLRMSFRVFFLSLWKDASGKGDELLRMGKPDRLHDPGGQMACHLSLQCVLSMKRMYMCSGNNSVDIR
jgi:hypothetical protein